MAIKRHRAAAPKARRSKARPVEIADVERHSMPAWVTSMHQHYQQTGFFRAEDLTRVLGDPRDAVEVRTSTEMCFSGYTAKHSG